MNLEYYYFPSSYWSRNVSLVIAEKGLEPKRHYVDITVNATFEPDYIRINPRGVVPTLVDDGKVVWDGPTIVKHLDARYGETLCPPDEDRDGWAVVKQLEDMPMMLFSYAVWVLGKKGEKSKDILADKIVRAKDYAGRYPDLADHYARKGAFFETFRAQVYDPAHVEQERTRAAAFLDQLGERVRDGSWLGGDRFGYADCLALSILYRLADLGSVDHWHGNADHPLQGYFERLKARPSFAQVFVDDPLLR